MLWANRDEGSADRVTDKVPAVTDEEARPFAELLFAACLDAAKNERQCLILARHYGLDGDGWQRLAAVAASLDLSRERVRQLLDDALVRMKRRGTSQRRGGQGGPCAALLRHAEGVAGPQVPGWRQAAWERLKDDPSTIPPAKAMGLLAYFGAPNRNRRQAEAEVEPFLRELREEARRTRREAFEQARWADRAARLQGLLDRYTVWPASPRVLTPDDVRSLGPARSVRHDGAGLALPLDSAKLGREVQCESLLEHRFFTLLDLLATVDRYQEQPCRIEYRLDGWSRPYHPDVLIVLRDGRTILAELKPAHQVALFPNLVKWAALARACDEWGFGLFIGGDRYAVQQVLQRPVPGGFEDALLAAVDGHVVRWQAYEELLRRFDADHQAMAAIVLRHGLELRLAPFRLSRLPSNDAEGVGSLLARLRAAGPGH
jgi:Sigma-70, region 4